MVRAIKKNKHIWITATLITLLAALAAGFWVGKSAAAREYQEEVDYNILLNRSNLEGLGEPEGPIYVTGHKSPDADTVGSAIGYASMLRQLGYDAQPVVLGKIDNETEYVLDAAGLDTPAQLEDASGCNMVLVDHGVYLHSADGLEDANVLSIIDHHGAGTVTTGGPTVYDNRPLGATATIVWLRYRDYGLVPDKQTALAMVGSILSDTVNLKSVSTTFADREALKTLSDIAGITDIDSFYHGMFKASLDYGGMTDKDIFFSDYKEFEAGSMKYAVACIDAFDEAGALDLAKHMRNVIPAVLAETGIDMAFAQVNIFHDDISVTYLVPSDETASAVIETAFEDQAVFDGMLYRIEPGIGRKQVLVPAVNDVLEAYPKE